MTKAHMKKQGRFSLGKRPCFFALRSMCGVYDRLPGGEVYHSQRRCQLSNDQMPKAMPAESRPWSSLERIRGALDRVVPERTERV